jgi:hypothetical protein
MSFLVYLFVLLVAAGSVIFGLDWTQAPLNPPPYATPPAQTTTAPPAAKPEPALAARRATDRSAAVAPNVGAAASTKADDPAQAQARATDQAEEPATAASTAHCNIAACSASYRSFRASDCTYQPYEGERRLCTKTQATGRVAAAAHPRGSARRSDLPDERRLTDRRDYPDRRGWGFDFFGVNSYDDGR